MSATTEHPGSCGYDDRPRGPGWEPKHRQHARIALQRWECEGGALGHTASQSHSRRPRTIGPAKAHNAAVTTVPNSV